MPDPDNFDEASYLYVNWPGFDKGDAPTSNTRPALKVHALTTTKFGGYSRGEFSQFNLATHVDDDLDTVNSNRAKLRTEQKLLAEPVWLEQVHSNIVYRADAGTDHSIGNKTGGTVRADASTCDKSDIVCAVLTADCLPVFFCNQVASEVAVAHAGWRGLHQGIISKTVQAMHSPVEEILVSLGPAIGPEVFEVGLDVYQAFLDKQAINENAFTATDEQHYLCDIYQLARNELNSLGIDKISGAEYCTYNDPAQFYSYRRSPRTGRMASLIWLQETSL